ncbi:MAG: HAD family hydrolase [Chloroflexota bacterium]|nr:HAD family hydrolase [Chloroflexota bacterium]
MTIRAIIFDLGHTLWDIESHPEALDAAYVDMRATLAGRLGRDDLPEAAAFQAAVRNVLFAASETYFTNSAEVEQPPSTMWVDRGCRALGIALDESLLGEITPPLFATEIDSLVCADGTADELASLSKQGYRLGCITNTLANTAAIRAMLRKHGVERFMESVVVSADEGWRKPHRSLFEKAARELRADRRECVFVGDSPLHDVGGAKAAGMSAVLTRQYVTRPYGAVDPQPDAVIYHLRELSAAITTIGRSCGRARCHVGPPYSNK